MAEQPISGRISDIFCSIQGEGIYVGIEQVFVRFYGCNLGCAFCDTQPSQYQRNTPQELLEKIMVFGRGCHSVALTGGEPLLQQEFLANVLRLIKQNGMKVYLETNGTLYNQLSELIDNLDIIAMDIKLPSSAGGGELWPEHKNFLDIARRKNVFVKAVICRSTKLSDIQRAVNILVEVDRNIPFILQPNFPEIGLALINKIRRFQRFCLNDLSNVRVIPQMHRLLGLE
ncbi:MAG: 7-carboxy-7-deazaguanine synthase QueE [Candidatus Omnitrophota bacterium]